MKIASKGREPVVGARRYFLARWGQSVVFLAVLRRGENYAKTVRILRLYQKKYIFFLPHKLVCEKQKVASHKLTKGVRISLRLTGQGRVVSE